MNSKERIEELFTQYFDQSDPEIIPITGAGSGRQYYRCIKGKSVCIATVTADWEEAEQFFYLSQKLATYHLPIPRVLSKDVEGQIYIQEDKGQVSLLDLLLRDGYNDHNLNAYKQAITVLSAFHALPPDHFTDAPAPLKRFDKSAIQSDLNYFKNCFLDSLKLPFDQQLLQREFELLAQDLDNCCEEKLMYRDFQGRNILIQNGRPWLIDFQGTMKGPAAYDLVSLLWQAKAKLPDDWKDALLNHYLHIRFDDQAEERNKFRSQYEQLILIRLLQVLGAYGLRGLKEKKTHFISSIPAALRQLGKAPLDPGFSEKFEHLYRLILKLTSEDFIHNFE